MTLATVLAFIFYKEYPSIYVLVGGGMLLIVALIIGVAILRSILKNGLLKFITWQYASPELDDLDGENEKLS